MYFPGVIAAVQGDMPMLDAEMPAANGVVTARALARMYGAIANGGEIDGTRFLSRGRVAGLDRSTEPAAGSEPLRAAGLPSGLPQLAVGNVVPGFGHVGMGGSFGWADPAYGLAFSLVHNRLLTPFLMTDHAAFVGIYWHLIRQGCRDGPASAGIAAGDRVRVAVPRGRSRRRLNCRITNLPGGSRLSSSLGSGATAPSARWPRIDSNFEPVEAAHRLRGACQATADSGVDAVG